VIESVGNEPEGFPGLHALTPAVLMDGFLLAKLSDGIVVVAPKIGGIEEDRVVAKRVVAWHRPHAAAVRLEKRGYDPSVLVESFAVLRGCAGSGR
jgi:hypothetical protein